MTFQWTAAAIISAAAFLDLAFRGLAFRRIDSFGLSLASFSTVYSAIELGRAVSDKTSATIPLQRFSVAGLSLIALILYHTWCRSDLEEQINDLLDEVREDMDRHQGDPNLVLQRREILKTLIPLARRSVLVTFVGASSERFRPGKRTWRQQVVLAIRTIAVPHSISHENDPSGDEGEPSAGSSSSPVITESDLLLPLWMRRLGAGLFLLGGFLAFVAQVITF